MFAYGGGHDPEAEVYDPASEAWIALPPVRVPPKELPPAVEMLRDRTSHSTVMVGGRMAVVVGGCVNEEPVAEAFESRSREWVRLPDDPAPRRASTATVLPDGTVLVVGDVLSQDRRPGLAKAVRLDPGSDTWSPVAPPTVLRMGHTASALSDGRVVVAGGDRSEGPSIEIYDPGADAWTGYDGLSHTRSLHTAVTLPDDTVLLIGGFLADPPAELFDPATGMSAPA